MGDPWSGSLLFRLQSEPWDGNSGMSPKCHLSAGIGHFFFFFLWAGGSSPELKALRSRLSSLHGIKVIWTYAVSCKMTQAQSVRSLLCHTPPIMGEQLLKLLERGSDQKTHTWKHVQINEYIQLPPDWVGNLLHHTKICKMVDKASYLQPRSEQYSSIY